MSQAESRRTADLLLAGHDGEALLIAAYVSVRDMIDALLEEPASWTLDDLIETLRLAGATAQEGLDVLLAGGTAEDAMSAAERVVGEDEE